MRGVILCNSQAGTAGLESTGRSEAAVRKRPQFVAFDVIETVFSLDRLRARVEAIGLAAERLDVWFARTLRDAFALAATEVYAPFREVASEALAALLIEHECPADSAARQHLLDGFAELDPHPDAGAAFERLHREKIRIFTLTNGSAEVTRRLLQRSGLERFVAQVLSVDDVRHWKPRREVYLHAAACAAVAPEELALIAAHAWDIHGAGRAGLTTAYVARGKPYPGFMSPPHVTATSLSEAAEALIRLPTARV